MSELKDRGTHKTDSSDAKRHFKRLEDQQDRTEKDKDRASHLAEKLRMSGTQDGMSRVDSSVAKSGEVLDELAEVQKRSHDRAASQGETVEGELGEKGRSAKDDAQTARGEGSSIRDSEAKSQVEAAARAAEQDGKWLSDLRVEREKERKTSESRTEKRVNRVKETKVKTKLKGKS